MKIPIADVAVGEVVRWGTTPMMKTDVGLNGCCLCIDTKGVSYEIPTSDSVHNELPWREQPDGFKKLYEHISTFFPFKPQETYDNLKAEETK